MATSVAPDYERRSVGQNVFWIQNRWRPDEYLNIESGTIQTTPIQLGWLSARWAFEQVPGTNVFRIRNVWQPSRYLNIESGVLSSGPDDPVECAVDHRTGLPDVLQST